jgi:hypothetical protein
MAKQRARFYELTHALSVKLVVVIHTRSNIALKTNNLRRDLSTEDKLLVWDHDRIAPLDTEKPVDDFIRR